MKAVMVKKAGDDKWLQCTDCGSVQFYVVKKPSVVYVRCVGCKVWHTITYGKKVD